VPAPLIAQLQPPTSGGAVLLEQSLRFPGHYKRVLVIGAHPDDEDTELLTVLARQGGTEAAYLSLNRGEGGQNLIGPELGEALGILRTEELLSARRLDGAQQFFTRAYDFGYSKSLEDTWAHWPRDTVLKDVVRIVRAFRPQVIVSVFSGTPRDGHGQHMAAGWAAREAFRVAGDSTAFPELRREEGLPPWAALKLYQSTRFDTTGTTLRLDGGAIDPATGKTYRQAAMAGRSLHRSQDMGQLQSIRPSVVRLGLVASRTGAPETGLWSGIDTTMVGLQRSLVGLGLPVHLDVAGYLTKLELARTASGPDQARALQSADSVLHAAAAGDLPGELADQSRHLVDAWRAAAGVLVDARLDRPLVSPWTRAGFTCEVRAGHGVALPGCALAPRDGQVTFVPDTSAGTTDGAGYAVTRGEVMLGNMAPTTPYYLRAHRAGDLYRWPADPAALGRPFERAPLVVVVHPAGGSTAPALQHVREVTFRWNDQSLGEQRAPVAVVPTVDVRVTNPLVVLRRGGAGRQALLVMLHSNGADTVRGTVHVTLPEGWRAVAPVPFVLAPGAATHLAVPLALPRGSTDTSFTVTVRAVEDPPPSGAGLRRTWGEARHEVRYPHIRARGYLVPADARVAVVDLQVPALGRIGYVRGAADAVPEALQAAGFDVEVIPGAALAGSLSRFRVIVIGPRAYEVDSALVEHNSRLLDWVRSGGRVVVQYQQYGFFFNHLSPYPLYVASRPPGTGDAPTVTSAPTSVAIVGTALMGGHDRVTDESAPVAVVDPASPVLRHPNSIAPQDWAGWVQERGLYFARAWAPEYRSVIRTSDPGEGALEGGLLVARVGNGTYTYTGLSFFRQLPAGVPGAFRLFANLLAVGSK